MEDKSTIVFENEKLRLSARYDFIIYPIDPIVLRKVLTAQRYELGKPPTPDSASSFGVILEVVGLAGRRDGLSVESQVDRQVLTMNASNINELLSAFDELEKGLSTELGEELSKHARFYEAIMQFVVKTGRNPLDSMASLRKNYPICDKMSDILGQKVAPFSFRFSPAGTPIDSEDWFDFNIEPLIAKATNTYFISLILRSKTRSNVINKIKNLKQTISSALQLLESTSLTATK